MLIEQNTKDNLNRISSMERALKLTKQEKDFKDILKMVVSLMVNFIINLISRFRLLSNDLLG
jgi:hypothetical protein